VRGVAVLNRTQIRGALAAGGAVLVGSAVLGLAQPNDSGATDVAAMPAQLSVSIDDQHTGAASGEHLTYQIRVRNNGKTAVAGARISQRLPAALEPLSAAPAATVSRSEVAWFTNVPAGGEVTVAMTARVGLTHNNYPRLVTTGCVAPDGTTEAAVCGSDVNALRTPARSPLGSLLFSGFVLLLAAIGAGLWMWLRREPAKQPVRVRTSPVVGAGWRSLPGQRLAAYADLGPTDELDGAAELAGLFLPSRVRAAVDRLASRTIGHGARSPPPVLRRCERPSTAAINVVRAIAHLRMTSIRSAGSPVSGRARCRYR
jgi:uncharacterized repeat protein (TIGR01451 family)